MPALTRRRDGVATTKSKRSGYVDRRHGGGSSQREVRLLLPPHDQERREGNK